MYLNTVLLLFTIFHGYYYHSQFMSKEIEAPNHTACELQSWDWGPGPKNSRASVGSTVNP